MIKRKSYGSSKEGLLDKQQPKWKKQRKKRGFDDTELWSLDYTFAVFIYPRLKRFRNKCTHGYPGRLNSIEEWHVILDKMIIAFKTLAHPNRPYGGINITIEELKELDEKVIEGTNLFGDYFGNLWD